MPYIIDRGKIIPVNCNAKYDSKPLPYKANDLDRVFVHYDSKLGKNISTENKLYDNGGANKDGKNCI